jgi:N-methylhydantoinase B/oxoprolinase/acetone carboxylase alpha subunit
MSLISTPCTILRRSAGAEVDDYGDPIVTETEFETVCEIQQLSRDEPAAEGELGVSTWVVFFPVDTEVDTSDAVIVDGQGTFELVGDPWNATQGSASVNHVAATARKTEDAEVVS